MWLNRMKDAIVIGLFVLAAAAMSQCPVEDAHYVLRHAPDVTAYFQPVDSSPDWPSGVALVIRSRKSGETSWWLPWRGGTDNFQHLASTTDVDARDWRPPNADDGPRPFGNREYIGTDANYDVLDDVPHRGKPAPNHMLITDAGASHDSVFVAKQFFDLVSCSTNDS